MRLEKLKRIASLVTEPGPETETLPYVALENVIGGTGQLDQTMELPLRRTGEPGTARVRQGDVLFGKLRSYLAKSWLVNRDVLASTELLALRPRRDVEPRWLAYATLGEPMKEWAVTTSYGSKMPRTSWEAFGEFQLLVPPYAEQGAIADFLDAETDRIDAVIRGKQYLLARLDERERSLIEATLLGKATSEVPLRRLLMCPPQYGASESGSPGEADWPRYVRISDLHDDGTLKNDDVKRLSSGTARPYLLEDGDVLVARSGATVGKSFLYRESIGPACFAGYLIRLRFDPNRRGCLPRGSRRGSCDAAVLAPRGCTSRCQPPTRSWSPSGGGSANWRRSSSRSIKSPRRAKARVPYAGEVTTVHRSYRRRRGHLPPVHREFGLW